MSYIEDYCTQIVKMWEGYEPSLYLDSDGYATAGEGIMIPDLATSLKLPWCNPDNSLATQSEITHDWNRVLLMKPNLAASFYAQPGALKLQPEAIDALTLNHVTATNTALLGIFPDLPAYPEPAQLGVMDMGYNLGVPRLMREYVVFCPAVVRRDWKTAAEDCARNTHLQSFEARNSWTKNQFEQALEEAV